MSPADHGPRHVAVLGGGNGISAVLRGLSAEAGRGRPLEITAIVATADDGGSSGRLRRERGGLPPGDLRACLLALADDSRPFSAVFAHRYTGSGDLAGHALGNLILAALAEIEQDYVRAVDAAGTLLGSRGRVVPVSPEVVHLHGEDSGGERLFGESAIGRTSEIRRVWLEPDTVRPTPGVPALIRGADLVVLGPGSPYTSLLPVLLVPEIADAVRASRGRRVLVCNLMTQPGETLGMGLERHLDTLDRHVGAGLVQDVLVHEGPLAADRLATYAAVGSEPVTASLAGRRPETIVRARLATEAGKIRHDPRRLATALLARLPRPAVSLATPGGGAPDGC